MASTIDAEPICVIKSGVKLHKGPGKRFAVTWTVPKYMPFLMVDHNGKWLKVRDLEGETHWVEGSAVSHRTTCAVVKTKTAKLFTGDGPNRKPAELSSVDRYTAFKKIDRDDAWVKVRDEFAGTYWVHENNIWIPMARTKVGF